MSKKNEEKRTSVDVKTEIEEIKQKLKDLRKEEKLLVQAEEKEKREREYRERVQKALEFYDHKEEIMEFYDHKDLFETCYAICKVAKTIKLQDSETTIFEYLDRELKRSGKSFDWKTEV